MFDKLDDLLIRFEEVLNELGEPGCNCKIRIVFRSL